MIKTYTKIPVEIRAVIWDGSNLREVVEFLEGGPISISGDVCSEEWCDYTKLVKDKGLEIPTLGGVMVASIGDYIIEGVKGFCYPCKPDIFKLTYV